jgi:hypothetical protein
MLVAAIAVAAFSIYKNSSKEEELSDIVKANIEALAERADEPTDPPLANGGDLPGAGGGGGSQSVQPVPAHTGGTYKQFRFVQTKPTPPITKCGWAERENTTINGTCIP